MSCPISFVGTLISLISSHKPKMNIGITAMNEALTSQLVNIPSINSERNSVASRAMPPAIGVGKACRLWGFIPGISSSL